jgi:hypothetical protein
MVRYFADTATETLINWTLPAIWSVLVIYLLIYGPWVIIPTGLFLVARLFFVKKRTQKATVIALSTLAFGILLAMVALLSYASDGL